MRGKTCIRTGLTILGCDFFAPKEPKADADAIRDAVIMNFIFN